MEAITAVSSPSLGPELWVCASGYSDSIVHSDSTDQLPNLPCPQRCTPPAHTLHSHKGRPPLAESFEVPSCDQSSVTRHQARGPLPWWLSGSSVLFYGTQNRYTHILGFHPGDAAEIVEVLSEGDVPPGRIESGHPPDRLAPHFLSPFPCEVILPRYRHRLIMHL